MLRISPWIAVLLVALASAVAAAEVHKCTEPDGRKVYQDVPCKAHQQAATFDPSSTNLTTIDSEASRREAQEALITREAGRQNREAPPSSEDVVYEPDYLPELLYPPEPVYYPYPVYPDRDHRHPHHHHDRPRVPQRPDPTPMGRPPRGGGGYVPPPPTIREVAPRPPAAPRGRQPERDGR